jgi:hypothetical protein
VFVAKPFINNGLEFRDILNQFIGVGFRDDTRAIVLGGIAFNAAGVEIMRIGLSLGKADEL